MNDPISVVVKVAATPDQAKVYVALLQSAGIPAHVEGDALADEVAISRRVMNLGGVRVMVPPSSLERARDILKPTAIDEEDLAAQALAATEGRETPPPERPHPRSGGGTARVVAGIAICAALLFFFLWQAATQTSENPLYRFETDHQGQRTYLRRNGIELQRCEDGDRDGIFERLLTQSPDGSVSTVSDQADADGLYRRTTVRRRGDLVETWTRPGSSPWFDECTVTDATGKVVQRLVWQPGMGFRVADERDK